MPDVGDFRRATLTVNAGDEDTVAVLTVYDPDLQPAVVSAVKTADVGGLQTWTSAPYELVKPGEWIESWRTTGTGAGRERKVFIVDPEPEAADAFGRTYATTGDYAKWLKATIPAGSRLALARASLAVDEMMQTAFYETDDDGYPSDVKLREAFRWATCAQAEYSRAIMDPKGIGHTGALQSVSIGSVSIGRGNQPGGGSTPIRHSLTAWQLLQRGLGESDGGNLSGPITGW